MSVVAVARRYADALADVASARNEVDQIDREVLLFADMLKSHSELRDVFASPIISLADKRRVLDALIDRIRPGQMTINLLRTMLSHYRLQYLAVMHEQFRRVINERKGLIIAEVTTAGEFDRAAQARLANTLERMTGKQIEFKFKTDPSLIGGVVTRLGSVVYDGSVRTQLKEIKERLKQGDTAI